MADLPPSYEQAMRASLIKQPETLHISDSDTASDDDDDLLVLTPSNERLEEDAGLILRAASPPTTQAPPIPSVAPSVSTNTNKPGLDLLSSDLASFDATVRSESVPAVPQRTDARLHRADTLPVRHDKILQRADTMPARHDVIPPDVVPRRSTGPELPPKRYSSRSKKPYRKWNPPMLGTLPDDFLRLEVMPKSRWGTESRTAPIGRRSSSPGVSLSASPSAHARSPKQPYRSSSFNTSDHNVRPSPQRPPIQHRKGLLVSHVVVTCLSGVCHV